MMQKGMFFLYTVLRRVALPAVLLLILTTGYARANGTEPYQHELRGKLKKGDTLIVKDEKFRNPSYDWSKITHHSVLNYIKVELLRDSMQQVKKPFSADLDLKVEYWSQPDQDEPVVIKSVPLKVNYDTATGAVFQAQDIYSFKNAHRIKITINEISCKGLEEIPGSFILTGQIFVERQYTLEPKTTIKPFAAIAENNEAPAAKGGQMGLMALSSPTPAAGPNQLKLSWTHAVGTEEIDLEWTTISSSSTMGQAVAQWEAGASPDLPAFYALFRNNATRITTEEQEYTISLVYSDDYLLFRMRPVTYQNNIRMEGDWSYLYRPSGASEDKLSIIKLPATWHEPALNWQYSGTFAEGGKKKEVVSYMDGTLRGRQTVTVSNSNIASVAGSDQVAVVQQQVFDEFGRPVASLLPSPLKNENTLKYYPGVFLNSNGKSYDYHNVYGVIAGSVASCINKPLPVSTSSAGGAYYSPANTFMGNPAQPHHDYIPDAEGFPLSVTRYTADKTGRVAVQGGVGAAFQPDPAAPEQHTTRLFFSKPGQWELDRVFGNDAGPAAHYMKNTVIDPNGQASVSYVNLSGKTVATALAGPAPAAAEALPSMPAQVSVTQPLLQPEDFVFDATQLKMKGTTTYVTPIQDDVELTYDIDQLIHRYSQGVTICSNCYYALTITVYDNCGVEKYSTSTPVDIGARSANCGLTGAKTGTTTVPLAPGEYFITYELSLSADVISDYTDTYIQQNTNLRKQFDFILDQLKNSDFSGCFNECTSCLTSLGTQANFSSRVLQQLTASGVDVNANAGALNTWVNGLYTALLSNCQSIQASCAPTPCAAARVAMLADVTPGGQFAPVDEYSNAAEPNINVLSLNFRKVFPVSSPGTPGYDDNKFTDIDGLVTSPADASFTVYDLIRNWQPSWAEKFLFYHPEYCKLESCEENATFMAWDEKVKTRAETAADIPMILPGQSYQSSVPTWLLDADPFFTSPGSPGTTYYTNMRTNLLNYTSNVLGITSASAKSITQYTDYLLYCADPGGNTNTAAVEDWDNCYPSAGCRVTDREWQLYRDMYFEMKNGYYQALQSMKCQNAGACEVGEPLAIGAPGCPAAGSFSLTRVDSATVKLTHEGALLDRTVTVQLYYPPDMTAYASYFTFNAGESSKTFSMPVTAALGRVLVSNVSCSYVPNETRPCFNGPVNAVALPSGTRQVAPDKFEYTGGGVTRTFWVVKGTPDVADTVQCSGSATRAYHYCLYLSIPGQSLEYSYSNVWLVDCTDGWARMAGATSSETALPGELKQKPVSAMMQSSGCDGITTGDFVIQSNGPVHFMYYEYVVTYVGPPIPPNTTVYHYMLYNGSQIWQLPFTSSITENSTLVDQNDVLPDGEYFYQYSGAEPGIFCETVCPVEYKYKTSRFPDYSTAQPDPATLISENHKKLAAQIKTSCENQADAWMEQLRPCLDGNGIAAGTRTLLRSKLVEVCQLGGDMEHIFGASTALPGRSTAEGYTSFRQVITAVLGAGYFSMDCNPWMLESPFPYKSKPQATAKELTNTNTEICNKLAYESSQHQQQNPGVSFYQYLASKYGAGVNLTEADLAVLQKGCNNCRFVLDKTVTLPVFLDPGAKGCISPTEFTAALNALAAEGMAGFSTAHVNYETVYTNYLNHHWGFTLGYRDYKTYEALVAANPATAGTLCNKAVYRNVRVDPYACLMDVVTMAVNNGKRDYERYIEEEKQAFRRNYINTCAATRAAVKLKAHQQYYHYTLYYYDLAGNLVRTIPPEGVHVLTQDWEFEAVRNSRTTVGQGVCNYGGPTGDTGMDPALTRLETSLNGSGQAIEMWIYNPTGSAGQVQTTSLSKKHLFNVCVDGRYLHVEVQNLLNSAAETEIVSSNHLTVDMQPLLPLRPWTHIVLQGAQPMATQPFDVYVNGTLCSAVAGAPAAGCGWEMTASPSGTQFSENLAVLKHLRQYNRLLPSSEIAANAKEPCLNITGAYPESWARMNTPSTGSETVAVPGTTIETQNSGYYPQHTLPTSYTYNSLGGVMQQKSPDGGLSKFWYDVSGRLVFSQNAEQFSPVNGGTANRYSYTKYDALGRIEEVGEKSQGDDLSVIHPYALELYQYGWYLQQGTNAQVTRTYYDMVPTTVPGINYTLGQNNLRKRVAVSGYFEDGITASQAHYYDYDISGNVKTLWQQIRDIGTKRIDYEYDLVSGKVNFVAYQRNQSDQFFYQYKYDAENRLVEAKSGIAASTDWRGLGTIVNGRTDATYRYYKHGPLARTELGDYKLQGLDYAYTLQGWLKGVNGVHLNTATDIGKDGTNGVFPDVLSYTLGYYTGDYKAVNASTAAFPVQQQANAETGHSLYNGNIGLSTMRVNAPFSTAPAAYTYRYDQLNRLVKQRQHTISGSLLGSVLPDYLENAAYDGNGNILSYLRKAAGGADMDNLSYAYPRDGAGQLTANRLRHVTDAVLSSPMAEDLESQPENNYLYDNIGNLRHEADGSAYIEWTVYGKIKKITRIDGSLEYGYDAGGNRVYKQYHRYSDDTHHRTWYVRDAQGNVLAVYGNKDADWNVFWKEQHLYGSSRLGMWLPDMNMQGGTSSGSWNSLGLHRFELGNHLGNVLATISDAGVMSGVATVHNAQDYYPFGMRQPGRTFDLTSGGYRYGFNGKENDNEIKGEGNQQDYGMRVYDPRLGRFLSVDPLTPQYPHYTPYQFAGNMPIRAIDLDGGEPNLKYTSEGIFGVGLFDQFDLGSIQRHDAALRIGKGDQQFQLQWLLNNNGETIGYLASRIVPEGEYSKYYGGKGEGLQEAFVIARDKFGEFASNSDKYYKMSRGAAIYEMTYGELDRDPVKGLFDPRYWLAGRVAGVTGSLAGKLFGTLVHSLPKSTRLAIFTTRLGIAAPASNINEAIGLINKTLDDVEDMYSGVRKAKGIPNRDDGRMYGILDDKYVTTLKDGTKIANTKGNRIVLQTDGGFKIQTKDGSKTLFEKAGKKTGND